MSSSSHTIASVDGSTVVRNSTAAADAVTHPETLVYNNARTGYLTRTGGAARPFHALPLLGVGLTALYMPATATAPRPSSHCRSASRFRHTLRPALGVGGPVRGRTDPTDDLTR